MKREQPNSARHGARCATRKSGRKLPHFKWLPPNIAEDSKVRLRPAKNPSDGLLAIRSSQTRFRERSQKLSAPFPDGRSRLPPPFGSRRTAPLTFWRAALASAAPMNRDSFGKKASKRQRQ